MKEERFSIHVRAWGAGIAVIWVGLTTIMVVDTSPWLALLYLLLLPLGWVIWTNEKLPGGVEK